MIEDTIGKIEARIQGAEAVKEERRQELLQLLATLKSEVADLSKTHEEQAQSIAGFTEISTHEAIRMEQNPELPVGGWLRHCQAHRQAAQVQGGETA